MAYLDYITCLRYAILVRNPQILTYITHTKIPVHAENGDIQDKNATL